MNTRSTPYLPRPVLEVCGRNNVRRGYKSFDDAGDSVLFLRHGKRPRLDPFFCMNLIGEYEIVAVPDPPSWRKSLSRTQTNEVYIFSEVPPWATTHRALGLPHLGTRRPSSQFRQRLRSRIRPCISFQANAAAIAAPPSTRIAHQPKTTPRHVPRLSLVRQEMPTPVSTSVQMVKTSMEVAME